MTTRTSPDLPAPFFDFAMSVLMVFVALFVLATFDTPRPPQAGVLTPKAEFLIELTWDDGSASDVDLYAKGPDGKIVFFGSRRTETMFLDQDNTGNGNGSVVDRREIVTVRAIEPGRYEFNAHAYRLAGPASVKMRVLKLNPYSVVSERAITFDMPGQERTLAAMNVRADGSAEPYEAQTRMVGK
ncbi:hypothetical protein [Bosea sp. FBZP-16]|uniref:hypothetical protein n=1 Tax=Bosea sp. FBZP-16 TaxID=2065382 RepID=UPI001319F8FA|nr:hypothetical protein [Bosea sp. FBZP-16]